VDLLKALCCADFNIVDKAAFKKLVCFLFAIFINLILYIYIAVSWETNSNVNSADVRGVCGMCLLSILFGGKKPQDDSDWIDEIEEIEAIIEEEEDL